MPKRVILVAVGGPSCSGKTTLAKHLRQILPNSTILHQDDFAPPAELLPVHPVHGVQDWDEASTAIEWDRQRSTIRTIRASGNLPSEHSSHDHMNEQPPVPVSSSLQQEWRGKFTQIQKDMTDDLFYVIADGFLIFYDEESVKEFDVRLFVREGYEVLKKRREERSTYFTSVQSSAEGSLWKDPPGYFDQIVWPAYISAHRPIFLDGNVETGEADQSKIEGLVVYEAGELGMEKMLSQACETIERRVRSGKTAKDWTKP